MTKDDQNDPARLLARLAARLTALRKGEGWTDFAKRVGVAPGTLSEVVNASIGAYRGVSDKKAQGRAESLERIVQFANSGLDDEVRFSLEEVLSALGLADREADIRQAVARSVHAYVQRPEVEFRTHGDPVLIEIERRRRAGEEKPIKAGVDVWPPFFSAHEDIKTSFAGRFLRRLLGSLSPEHWHEPALKELSYQETVDADPIRTGELDVVFSMYDVPARRLEGFDFIRIPGLRGTLAALAIGFQQRITWERILDRDDLGAIDGLQVAVVQDEVGDVFLSGSCDYSERQIERLKKSVNPSDIARGLWEILQKQLDSPHPNLGPLLFCGDSAIVAKTLPELKSIIRAKATRIDVEADDVVELVVDAADGSIHFAPMYPMGLAVNGRAARWRLMLEEAMHSELFLNGAALTAKHYIKMLSQREAVSLRVVDLSADLPSFIATPFHEHLKRAYGRHLETLCEQGIEPTREFLERVRPWFGDAPAKITKSKVG